ncbi:hypothetical protein LVJ94_25880 [Pendulispora rubella]|uniref:Uncharacterized protein n=1 Tax=Pendulispora rubella TaxID=2741070 RepID=A0ABZ2LI64_9BACT
MVLVSATVNDNPFDIRHIWVIFYDINDPFWGTKLIDKVAENILSALAKSRRSAIQDDAKEPGPRSAAEIRLRESFAGVVSELHFVHRVEAKRSLVNRALTAVNSNLHNKARKRIRARTLPDRAVEVPRFSGQSR